jgi:type IV pilus assembly protein PilV
MRNLSRYGNSRSRQGGVMLLEALIGLLIFSLGILALVAMQSVSVSNVSNARYRVEAAFLADEALHRIALSATGTPTLAGVDAWAVPGGTSTEMFLWVQKIQSSTTGLPGAQGNAPTITITNLVGPPLAKQVVVTVRWKAPDALAPSSHVAIGYISNP